MTSKQAFEYALVELNKREAPSLLLEDYNYFFNKAVNQFINRMYNAYEINQQKTDDLRVLKGTAILTPVQNTAEGLSTLFNKTYEVDLPDDYLHMLNCIVEYKLLKTYKCYNADDTWQQGAKRLTSDMFGQIINNYYLRPSYKNPYYYINNVTTGLDFPTADNQIGIVTGYLDKYILSGSVVNADTVTVNGVTFTLKSAPTGSEILNTLEALYHALSTSTNPLLTVGTYSLNDQHTELTILGKSTFTVTKTGTITISTLVVVPISHIEKIEDIRYGNRSKVRMEIRYGKDNSTFELQNVFIDYLKTPQFIRLTQSQVDEVEDNSQLLEFPDYVCQEIVNELIKLLMENASDPRLQSHIPINQSIANPSQEQAPRK